MRSAILALLLFCTPAFGQVVPLEISGGDAKVVQVDKIVVVKEDVTLVSSFPFKVKAPAGGLIYTWQYPATVTATDENDTLEVTAAPKGNLTISVKITTVDFKAQKVSTKVGKIAFAVGEIGPAPKPEPKPKPDEPPTIAPIPAPGFRFLILYESDPMDMAEQRMSPQQNSIITSAIIRDWADANCPVGPDGKTPERRMWDWDVDTSSVTELWRNAVTRSQLKAGGSKKPWILISNGDKKNGYEGPLPANVADTLELLKKWKGN
jgi:hypothetical protein